MEKAVLNTMVKVECYMKANKLALNSDKSQVMVVSNNTEIKKNFEVIMNGKKVRHKEHITILGNTMSASLTWDAHITKVLIPSLSNRVRTLQIVSRYLPPGFRAVYANSIFRSRLLFWDRDMGGGPPETYQQNTEYSKQGIENSPS